MWTLMDKGELLMAGGLILAVALIAVLFATDGLQEKQNFLLKAGNPTLNNALQPASPTTMSATPLASAGYANVFASLDAQKAQKICLDLAKQFAGSNAWAVYSCRCSELASSERKDYSCTIDTLQGGKPATAVCVKSQEKCTMSAEGYTRAMTFEEIAQKYG